MKEFLIIALSIAIFYFLYRGIRCLLSRYAKKELASSGLSWRADGAIHLEAMAESMEYYAYMAVLASDYGRMPVVIHIRKNDGDRAELIFIGERLARRYQNLTVRIF